MVADYLSEEEIDGIKQIFEMMDTDKNGNLSFEELRDGFKSIGHPITDPDVQMLIDAVSLLFFRPLISVLLIPPTTSYLMS